MMLKQANVCLFIMMIFVLFITAGCQMNFVTLTTTVDPPDYGYVFPLPGEYPHGSKITVSAVSSVTGWKFSHWGGDFSGEKNPAELKMDGDKRITAYFYEPVYFYLDVYIYSGSGDVQPSYGTFESGTWIDIYAYPDMGYTFENWYDYNMNFLSDANPLRINIDSDMTIYANFTSGVGK